MNSNDKESIKIEEQIAEYEKQIANLQKIKSELLSEQRTEKLKEVRDLISQYEFTRTELGLNAGKRKMYKKSTTLQVKYINPNNPSETWHGGRGAKPKWIVAYLATGGRLEDIEIK